MNQFSMVWKVLITCFLITACSSPNMLVDHTLQEKGSVYEVAGRNGWLVNQHISFGDFQSGEIKRSWTKGYDIPFIVRFTGAKEKLSFSLKDGKYNTAEVFCLGKLREQDLLLFHEYFDINIKAKDAFTGSVALNETFSYDFYVMNLNQNNWFREAKGWIKGGNLEYMIRPVEKLDNTKRSLDMQVPGFEFVLDNEVVGAVETLNRGKIWLQKDLDETQKLVLASVASALLLRSELADHNDQNI